MTVEKVHRREINEVDGGELSELEVAPPPVGEQNAPDQVHHVRDLYGRVKNKFPLLKTGLDSFEKRLPIEFPVIDKLDDQINTLNEKIVQWKSLRGQMNEKAVNSLERGFSMVQEFSATRGKDMLHFDLIMYSKEVLENASAVSMPIYEHLHQNVAIAVAKLNVALSNLQESVADKSAKTKEQTKVMLNAAIDASRDLSNTSIEYVRQRYSHLIDKIPAHYNPALIAGNFPYPLGDAVMFILSSPALFMEVASKADITRSNRAIDNAKNLLEAVKAAVNDVDVPSKHTPASPGHPLHVEVD